MKNRVIEYNGYVISTEEGTEKGLFFRSPIQKVDFDVYCDEPKLSVQKYLNDIKNPIRKAFEVLIGNKNNVNNIERWLSDENCASLTRNILCFPIYFNRKYRKLTAVSSVDNSIQEINSYGYEREYDICAGYCNIERTTIKLKNGKTIKIKRPREYCFTYEHIVKGIIDSGSVPIKNK